MSASRENDVLSVTQVTSLIRQRLLDLPTLWIEGEITDVSRPSSGHIYFAIKDKRSVLRCIMWRSDAEKLGVDLEDGMAVLCRGEIDVYVPYGRYQLIAKRIELKGEGQLQAKLRQLQQRLAGEGLFDRRFKKPLPRMPRRLAIVTSPTGAALHDFLETAIARWPAFQAVVVPSRVQGVGAATELAEAIRLVQRMRPAPDVVVLTRGGGSLQDLWCFNEEPVVRAIFHCSIPVISAIGHDIDVTLSDLVADERAVTPTAAAERALPAREEILGELTQLTQRLQQRMLSRLQTARASVTAMQGRRVLTHPGESIQNSWRRVDQFEQRMVRAARNLLHRTRQQLETRAAQLDSLSPLAVLSRGYSLTLKKKNGELLMAADQIQPGELIRTRLADGEVVSRVEE